jgi:ApaG protein
MFRGLYASEVSTSASNLGSTALTPLGRPPSAAAESTQQGHIRVDVLPVFLPDQSDPVEGEFVFGYRVRITNNSDRIVQLLSRRWTIIDAHGRARNVEGEGVVGRQPILGPTQFFQYESFCPIKTRWGTMEGSYTVRARETSVTGESASSILDTQWPETLAVKVGRFYLVVPKESGVEVEGIEDHTS